MLENTQMISDRVILNLVLKHKAEHSNFYMLTLFLLRLQIVISLNFLFTFVWLLAYALLCCIMLVYTAQFPIVGLVCCVPTKQELLIFMEWTTTSVLLEKFYKSALVE